MGGPNATLSRVPGVRVGQAEDLARRTGLTVIRFERPAPTVVEVRGGASGTYDTASLSLDATFGAREALFFSGGSLFGLDASTGIRGAILREGGGVKVFGNPNRIVPIAGAILFDLPGRRGARADYARLGARATTSASRDPVVCGRVGAGSGASVGKYLGRSRAQPGGVGSAAIPLPDGGWLGALAAVNAVGALRDPATGQYVAGPRGLSGEVVPPLHPVGDEPGSVGTTLVAVATDRAIARPQLQRLAVSAHDGLASAIVPAHASTDGDAVFVSSTARSRPGSTPAPLSPRELDRIGILVADVVVRSVLAAVRSP
jgi:L-aminopeptidase/D-esterase-like protein